MTLIDYSQSEITESEINQRVQKHIPLARKIAWQVHGRVRDLLDIDDLIQIGMIALIEAAQRFQDTGEATFGTYAAIRVKGALIDHLRSNLRCQGWLFNAGTALLPPKRPLRMRGATPIIPSCLRKKLVSELMNYTIGRIKFPKRPRNRSTRFMMTIRAGSPTPGLRPRLFY